MTRFARCGVLCVLVSAPIAALAPISGAMLPALPTPTAAPAHQAETRLVIGEAERDLTGDGRPEALRVVGVGPSIDSLAVTFTIASDGRTIYRYDLWPMTRAVGFDGRRQVLSVEQHRARLEEFGPWFLGAEKFERPDEFVSNLRKQAPARAAEIPEVIERDRAPSDLVPGDVIWREIRTAPVTIFTFSPGGDALVAIGWNARAGRFYRLLDCC